MFSAWALPLTEQRNWTNRSMHGMLPRGSACLRVVYDANAFSQDLSDWDTPKVRNMDSIFGGAEDFNHVGHIQNFQVLPLIVHSCFRKLELSDKRECTASCASSDFHYLVVASYPTISFTIAVSRSKRAVGVVRHATITFSRRRFLAYCLWYPRVCKVLR